MGAVYNSAIGVKMWNELKADADFKKNVKSSQHVSVRNQYICHAVNPLTIWKSSWNLEPWRKQVSLFNTYRAGCNPS